MTSTWLDLSGKLDPRTAALYEAVESSVCELKIPFVVIGASVRDMVLHYGYGADIHRATVDIDFGIQVRDWDAFESLRTALINLGFKRTGTHHRLQSPDGLYVDIVPFGGVEDDAASIHWPPDGANVMSVLGFKEALNHANIVRIRKRPDVFVEVASLEGMVLLKLIAWMDRPRDTRRKDADDLVYLLRQYENIPVVKDNAFERPELMGQYGWNLTKAATHLLGEASRAIAADRTAVRIGELFANRPGSLTIEALVEDMCRHMSMAYEVNRSLLAAFRSGFDSMDGGNNSSHPT